MRVVTNKRTGKQFAAKFKEYSSEAELERHCLEFGAIAALDHPNIVRCRDIYVNGNKIIIVTDLVEGGNLTEVAA